MGTSAAARKGSPGIPANRSSSRTRKRSLSECGSGKAPLGSAWICRICHGDEGWLVAPCSCRGTVAWVHRACLERWLSEAGRDSCELCGTQFRTVRVPRHGPCGGLLRWLATGLDARQLLMDLVLLMVLTPLVMMALYLVVWSTRAVSEQADPAARASYMLVVTMMSSSFVLASYYSWLTAAVQQHVEDWRQWWRTNYSVRLLEDGPSAPAWRTRLGGKRSGSGSGSVSGSGRSAESGASVASGAPERPRQRGQVPRSASATTDTEEVQLQTVSYSSVAPNHPPD